MRTPTEFDIQDLLQHMNPNYNPAQAHEYYERTKKLKGRKKGSQKVTSGSARGRRQDPRTGKKMAQIKRDARSKQRKELSTRITSLEGKLKKLEALLKKKMHEEGSEDRKGKAKKERAAKEADKPKTAAEKAEAAREGKKDRAKNQQKLKTAAKKDDGKAKSKSSEKKATGKKSVSHLKAMVTKTKGKIAVAKQKLATL